MPQELRVLQCLQCETFQVDIVKKSNKWQCKMCNAKQNLRKVLFQGTGADCRKKVQQFNQEKANRIEQKSDAILNLLEDDVGENVLLEAANQIDENADTTQDFHDNVAFEREFNKQTISQKRKPPMDQHGIKSKTKASKWDIFL